MLKSAVQRAVPNATVETVKDQASLQAHLSPDRVLLINRVLGGSFSIDSGVALIEQLAQSDHPPVMMLISNFPEAQQAAVAVGAMQGFGKAQVHHESTASLLRDAAAASQQQQQQQQQTAQ